MTDAELKALKLKQQQDAEAARGLITSAVAAAVSEAQAPVLKSVSDLAASVTALVTQMQSKGATSHMAGAPGTSGAEPERSVITGKSVEVPEGIRGTRIIKAHLKAKLDGTSVEAVLQGWGYAEEKAAFVGAREKALSQNVFMDGGALVPTEYVAEIVALLRNVTVVRKLGARAFPMGASMEMPTQDTAASAQYVGEAQPIVGSQQSLGGIRLSEKKLAALVVISNDLIRNAVLSAEQFVRDDLVQVLALKEDSQALFGVGSAYSPRGLTSLVDAAAQYNGTAASAIAPTLAEVKKELALAKRKLKTANIPMIKLGWVFSPRTEAYLYSLTDGNGNSVYAGSLDNGMLMGAPVMVTNQVPENLGWSADGSTDVSRIFFGDFSQFMIGESMAPQIEVFPNATYDLAGTVKSGISQDQSVIRALLKHDFQLRYAKSFVIVSTRMGV